MSDSDILPNRVLVAGFLWSGSSAVRDFLCDYDCFGTKPGEFDEFRRPGKVGDHLQGRISLMYPSTLPRGYFSDLKTVLSWILAPRPFCPLVALKDYRATRELSSILGDPKIEHGEKLEAARVWLDKLHRLYAPGKHLILDQPLLWGQHSDVWPDLMEPWKLIAVIRDPRDQLAETMRNNHLFYHFRSNDADIYGGGRDGAVTYFIKTLEARIRHFQTIRKTFGPSRVMTVKFEDLVYRTTYVRPKVEAFLGIAENCQLKKTRAFVPTVSMANVGIWHDWLYSAETNRLKHLLDAYEDGYHDFAPSS